MSVWFTSDFHLGHKNIIKYCNRPFNSVEEMDETIINNYNELVKENDVVYFLGDFTLGNEDIASKYFNRLNGKMIVLFNPWHHDRRWISKSKSYYTKVDIVVYEDPIVVLEGKPPIILCHYPIAQWDRKHYGSVHLHGHSHGTFKYPEGALAYDIGVDVQNFYPVNEKCFREVFSKSEGEQK